MANDDFYRSHWVDIEDERLERYEQMFVYRPAQDPLIAPLELSEGLTVADYGCGPGFMAAEFANRVGPKGQVYGIDINEKFLERARQRMTESDIANLEFRQLDESGHIPLEDSELDRLFCKNVLEYVPDLPATLREQHRVLKTGGRIEVIDSDWDFVVVEPWGADRTRDFFKAAAPAFKEPNIGRKLRGALGEAGFTDISVTIVPVVDTTGSAESVIKNMNSYIREFDSMPEAELEVLMNALADGIAQGSYLFVLPQFVVTGTKG